jgi:alpha-N-arabinofuranosidase
MLRNTSVLVLLAACLTFSANGQRISVTVDAAKTAEPITKYVYGQFIEHLGDIINKGLWAEMLDDRKFFFEVNSAEQTQPQMRRKINRWRPVGPDEFVVMDRERPWVGKHSPLIKLDGAAPHGLQQAGLALRKGRGYTGRVVLAGEAGAKVTVSLVWGPNPGDRQTIPISPLRSAYSKFPLKFTAGADTENGGLEITGTGKGSFHVGAVSLMPADNIQGFRADTTRLLKQLNSGIYRFPGGNYVSNHEWRDAIGDLDRRPPHWDYAWSVVQPNDVGTDEFMVLCRLLDVEPYIAVNAGFGDAHSAAAWVEYANGPASTPMGRLRAANGHPEPYKIKWWGIGNEMYGSWQLGHMSLRHFAIKHNLFAEAMRKADPTIKLIASGASPDEMTVTQMSRRITGNILTEYGSDADWTGGLLANCADSIDVISEHYYCYSGQRFDLNEGKFVNVEESLVDWARRPANRIRCKVEHYQEYLKRFPALTEKKIPINIDEWAYSRIRPNLKLALSNAWALHEMFRHTDIIKMAAYTFATSCLAYDGADAVFNNIGVLFKLYRDHFGTVPVEVRGDSPQPAPKYPVGGDQPNVNAGSDTYPLDVAAALSSDRKKLTVAIINPTESVQQLDLAITGVALRGQARMWRITGPDLNAAILVGQKPGVELIEVAVPEIPKTLAVAPISINLYAFEIQ